MVLDFRVLDDDGNVLDQGTTQVAIAYDTCVAAARAQQRQTRRRVRGYLRDPDGDIWPDGIWQRVIEVTSGR